VTPAFAAIDALDVASKPSVAKRSRAARWRASRVASRLATCRFSIAMPANLPIRRLCGASATFATALT
jgi:hypothetical protein